MPAVGAPSPDEGLAPGSEVPTGTVLECQLELVLHGADAVLAGHPVEIRAMKQVDERSWRAVRTSQELSSDLGVVSMSFPCDMRLSLRSSGWVWANQPERVVVREGMVPMHIQLRPELTVRLFVHGGGGPKAEGVRFHLPGDDVGQPVPPEGLLIPGLRMSEVAGEIRSSNLPTRSWRPARSDELEILRPGLVDAVVIIGDMQRSWLELGKDLDELVEGVLCVSQGERGQKCKFYQGVWRCPCGPPASLGLYGRRWDVGLLRPLVSPDLKLEQLPEVESLCLSLPQVEEVGARLAAQPGGVAGGLLLGGLPRAVVPGKEVCLRLPSGEDVDLSLTGTATGAWTVRAEGQGRQELSSP